MGDGTKISDGEPRLWQPDEGRGQGDPAPFQPYCQVLARSLAAALRRAGGGDVSVSLTAVRAEAFGDALIAAPPHTMFNVLRLEEWRSPGLLLLTGELLGAFMEVFFGGTGSGRRSSGIKPAPVHSPVTQRLARRVGAVVLSEFQTAFTGLAPGAVRITRQETDSPLAGIMSDQETAFVADFRLRLLGEAATATLILSLAALKRAMTAAKAASSAAAAEAPSALLFQLPDVQVEVVARLGEVDIDAQDLVQLAIGDVLLLDRQEGDPLDLLVEGIAKLKAEPTAKRKSKAIRILPSAA